MKKSLLFIGLCLSSFANFSFGQSQVTSKEPVPAVVLSHPELNTQRAKVEAKQSEITVAASRAQVSKCNDELRFLKEEYVRLLSAEFERTTETQLKTQLQEEIVRYSEAVNPKTR